MAKKFFYVCAGLFLLAGAYNLGATRATAQGTVGVPVAMTSNGTIGLVVTSTGEIYRSDNDGGSWYLLSSIYGGSTNGTARSWGSLKVQAR